MSTDLTWQELEDITDGFSKDRIVGSGGYGVVYKGVHKNGQEIAVKKLYHFPGLDEKQFQNEFQILTRLCHKNIVRLVGKSYEEQDRCVEYNGKFVFAKMVDRAICLEYLHNGSLEKHISAEDSGLPWHRRYKIIEGICEGLKYLHDNRIFHLDLKPANILLDNNMEPKITDFGLSRLFSGTRKSHTTTHFIGTLGYVPPEYIEKGKISDKFDIFSLGVIIIGILTGPNGYSEHSDMPPQEFIEQVHGNWRKRLLKDAELNYASYLYACCNQVKTCIDIALNCLETNRQKRSSIGDIICTLNETVKMFDELRKQPYSVHPHNFLALGDIMDPFVTSASMRIFTLATSNVSNLKPSQAMNQPRSGSDPRTLYTLVMVESIDLSRIRSLTVFGDSASFFIPSIILTDMENASGVTDKDLQKMLKRLLRLEFLSIRGCSKTSNLPSSVANLWQLQLLDVRHTTNPNHASTHHQANEAAIHPCRQYHYNPALILNSSAQALGINCRKRREVFISPYPCNIIQSGNTSIMPSEDDC